MPAFAKLLWLEAEEVRDPDGADEIAVTSGSLQFQKIRMRKDDVFEFNERFLVFGSTPAIDVSLFEVNEAASQATRIGAAIILADELGLGERTQRIEGAGALYELGYKVL